MHIHPADVRHRICRHHGPAHSKTNPSGFDVRLFKVRLVRFCLAPACAQLQPTQVCILSGKGTIKHVAAMWACVRGIGHTVLFARCTHEQTDMDSSLPLPSWSLLMHTQKLCCGRALAGVNMRHPYKHASLCVSLSG